MRSALCIQTVLVNVKFMIGWEFRRTADEFRRLILWTVCKINACSWRTEFFIKVSRRAEEQPSAATRDNQFQDCIRTSYKCLFVAERRSDLSTRHTVGKGIHSFISIQPQRPGWQEPEPNHVTGMALAHYNLGKFLGVVCHCFPPPLDVPTFAARCLYVRSDARDPSSERWNCGREIVR